MQYHSRTSIQNLRKRQQARAAAASSSVSASGGSVSVSSSAPFSSAQNQNQAKQQQYQQHQQTLPTSRPPSQTATGHDGVVHNNDTEIRQGRLQAIRMISDRLETGLNDDALVAIMHLLEQGYHPNDVANVVQSLFQSATAARAR